MDLDPVRAIRALRTILEEVTKHLDGRRASLPVEINARSDGYDTSTQRMFKETPPSSASTPTNSKTDRR